MASPAKKRKKNDSRAVPVPTRNLDFFFGKNAGGQEPKLKRTSHALSSPTVGQNAKDWEASFGKVSAESHEHRDGRSFSTDQELADEEFAKRLQAQWAEEDRERAGVKTEPEDKPAGQKDDEPRREAVVQSKPELQNSDRAGTYGKTTAAFTQGEPISGIVVEPTVSTAAAGTTEETVASRKDKILGLQSTSSAEDTVTQNIPFDQSPLTFLPSDYLPALQEHWSHEGGGDASYALLTRCFVLINSTTSRIKTVDTLVNCLRLIIEGNPTSLIPTVWLATNSISPPYISLELGLGGSAISKALKKVCGLDNPTLKTLYDKHGDAGDVAFEAKKKQSFTLRKPKPLTIKSVYSLLVKIATSKGNGSVEQKQRLVERLVQDARGAEESRYIVRTLVQHLRIGAVKTTMLVALSRAFQLARPFGADFPNRDITELAKLKKEDLALVWSRGEEVVKACFARRPNYDDLVASLLEVGVCDELLLRCGLALHVPLRPMLGNITRDLGDMLTKLQGRDFSCEYKYDGQRAQVHCDENGKVSIFSRHLEIMTEKYPDLVALVPEIRGDGVSSFILEGEVVAVDQESGELKTFQTLTNRARKDVDIGSIQVSVCLFAFDLMFLNGQQLLSRPFRERRGLLRSMFIEKRHRFTWVKSIDATSQDSETVLEFFKSATDLKCEGIMVKVLDNLLNPDLLDDPSLDPATANSKQIVRLDSSSAPSTPSKTKQKKVKKTADEKESEKQLGARRKALLSTYEPDKRLDSWLKVKKDYNSSTFDTIDLIPVAAWHGQGRKANWWSPILLACRNPETGSLEVVTKCMSGFTDKFYQANKEKYAEEGDNTTKQKPNWIEYEGGRPAVWFEPQEVWEMAFADITLSPVYTAAIGLVREDRGLSMRFPRFLKVREDKSLEEASTSDFLAMLYRKQEERVKADGKQKRESDGKRKGGPVSKRGQDEIEGEEEEEGDEEVKEEDVND